MTATRPAVRSRPRHTRLAAAGPRGSAVAAFAVLAPACVPRQAPDLQAQAPDARLAAIVQAAHRSDRSSVPGLVERLDSFDPAERLLAINALERVAGTRLGYDYAATAPAREPAVQRWVDWARDQGLVAEPLDGQHAPPPANP